MDSALQPDWKVFRFSNKREMCPACGQNRIPGRMFCGICTTHIDGAVLRTCRSLLLQSGTVADTAKKKAEAGDLADQQMPVGTVVKCFPLRFAQLIGRQARRMRQAGAWFAHVVAFRYIASVKYDEAEPEAQEIYEHPDFQDTRKTVYEILYGLASEDLDIDDILRDPQTLDKPIPREWWKLEELFSCVDSEDGGARHLMFAMVEDLERRKKLRVFRGEGNCTECGASIPFGVSLCESCQTDARMKISSGGGLAKPKPEAPAPAKGPERMYLGSEDSD